ncbi:uncharacterized protein CTHT_0036730 [Thermochaetoides thermophila DSM 1495]|uniref:Uncharacterized protein n=1 Tax=Chaetomium thermophilum (strain DSM 1495 / CBS 144.50 / IMI 039719) TaxID=759272 RepID=G0S7L3_CHATD|nr:hypothetical protein CTHT_0036730 [Thermochaetoides thermophila DSM 1495]EGS21804.1 hypothetical protein CTHT_0036730 [Thermochaetoides thermophila DSM 1495]
MNPSNTSGAQKTPANANVGEDKPKMFDEHGTIGKQFTPEGAIGGTAQKIGGPLDKEGMIGKQFTTEGSIGGTVQNMMGGTKKKSN